MLFFYVCWCFSITTIGMLILGGFNYIGLGIRSYIGLGISGQYTGFRPLEIVSFGTDFMQIPVL